jgi:hypothetical protein
MRIMIRRCAKRVPCPGFPQPFEVDSSSRYTNRPYADYSALRSTRNRASHHERTYGRRDSRPGAGRGRVQRGRPRDSLGLVGLPAWLIGEQIRRTRALTSKPFLANLIIAVLQGDELAACFDATAGLKNSVRSLRPLG